MIYKKLIIAIFNSILLCQSFDIARVQYDGGGDWYSDPSSIPNLLNYLKENTQIKNIGKEQRIRLTDNNIINYPYLYLTGHGNIRFSEEEVESLRDILLSGSFLHADDNYGMDKSFRREIKKVFPNKNFVDLPHDHPIFSSYFNIKNGLPKIHEHDNNPPRALAIFHNKKIILLYTFESDLGDGWEDESVHHDPKHIRESALQMGVNIIYHVLSD